MKADCYYKFRSNGNHFYRAVKEKKHVTIGFIGGSITDPRGRERWSEYVTSWFISEYPDVIVDVENAAIGATGSNYAVFRAQRDLIDRGCDIIFIEYAVNDGGAETAVRNASREGLIRKLANNTEADLVITYTYAGDFLQDMLAGKFPATITEFEELADYYGISSVFMSSYALDCVKRGVLRWEEWLPDGLHPAHVGSRFYSEPVCALLERMLEAKCENETVWPIEPLYADNWEFAECLPLEKLERNGYWRLYRCLDRPLVDRVLSSTCYGSSLKGSFEGTGVVLTVSFGKMSTDFRWRVDGGEWHRSDDRRTEWMDDYTWLKTNLLVKGLENGSHTLEIEVLPPEYGPYCKGCTFELVLVGVLKN